MKCKDTQEINLKTGRCRTKCTEYQERNIETGRCRKISSKPLSLKSPSLKSPSLKSPSLKSPSKSKPPSLKSPSLKSLSLKSPSLKSPQKKNSIYCGNNLLNSELVSGEKKLGTRYGCMQKGIGAGLYSKNTEKYNQNYEPIDKRKFYCGNKEILPTGYSDFGNLNQCFSKGFVLGQKIKNKEQDDKSQPK